MSVPKLYLYQCVIPENIHNIHTEGFFFGLSPHPTVILISASYIQLQFLPFKPSPHSLPLRISNDLSFGGYRYFWKWHILCY